MKRSKQAKAASSRPTQAAATFDEADSSRRVWAAVWENVKTIIIAFIVVFGFIRPFIFEIYRIPSGSMEDTLLVGDRVIVAKFIYGVRLPLLQRRLFAFHAPQRGDVFVFTGKHEPKTHFIKRVIAVEGDTVRTVGRQLFLNGKRVVGESFTKHRGAVLGDFPPFWYPLAPYYYEDPIAAKAIAPFSHREPVHVQTAKGVPVAFSRPGDEPIRVRVESRRLELSIHVPVRVYYRVVLENELPRRDYDLPYLYKNHKTGQWYLVRRLNTYELASNATAFRVPKDHVFAMGDNRENSVDSRGWGPVPLHMIKGKAVLIIWSTKERSRAPIWEFWKRLRFKRMGRIVRAQYGELES